VESGANSSLHTSASLIASNLAKGRKAILALQLSGSYLCQREVVSDSTRFASLLPFARPTARLPTLRRWKYMGVAILSKSKTTVTEEVD